MRNRLVPPHVPDRLKSEVKTNVEPIRAEERGEGVCLFVTGENGQRCGNPVSNNCHVIPESEVLNELRDRETDKVLELRWGAARWEHYYATSSTTSPIAPANWDAFNPQPVAPRHACVGRFACKCAQADHDNEFSPIDARELDFNDPEVLILSAYRAALYEADLCRLGKRLAPQHHRLAMQHHRLEVRVGWLKLLKSLQRRAEWSEGASERLGSIWYDRKTRGKLDADAVSVRELNFRSSLKFAACVFGYDECVIVTVFPLGGERHKMGVLNLPDDAEVAAESIDRLNRLADESENATDYGVNVLEDLMKHGAGSVAASPESYRCLLSEEQQTINGIVANASGAWILEYSFGSQRPVPKRAVRTQQRGRRKH